MKHIRQATLDDVPAIAFVQAVTWIDSYPSSEAGIDEDDIRAIDWQGKIPGWQHMVKSSDYEVVVAESETEIQGFYAVEKNTHSVLESLYVLPDYQSQGVGTELLRRATATHGELLLEVATYNTDAISFYTAHGFELTGARGAHPLPQGKHIPTVEMRLVSQVASQSTGMISRKQLAELSGERESTIKWYSEIGLLPFVQGESRRRRYYDTEQSLSRLADIKRLKAGGLSIEDIKSDLQA